LKFLNLPALVFKDMTDDRNVQNSDRMTILTSDRTVVSKLVANSSVIRTSYKVATVRLQVYRDTVNILSLLGQLNHGTVYQIML